MNILAFDTETTGVPNKKGSLDSQPHIVQLAATLYSSDRRPLYEFSTLVKLPENVAMPAGAQAVHGISAEESRIFGVEPRTAIAMLRFAAARADRVIAHNAQFDMQLLSFLQDRAGESAAINRKMLLCTCDAATPVVNLPPTSKMLAAGFTGPKRASLGECWKHFFNEELENAHDALVDTRGCARLYFHLLDNGHIKE